MRHVVAHAISRPAEGEFAEVAGAENERVHGIESVGNADAYGLNVRAGEAFHQAVNLDVVSLVATFVARVLLGGNVREAAHVALQRNGSRWRTKLKRNGADALDAFAA